MDAGCDMTMKISAIICTHNRCSELYTTLASLLAVKPVDDVELEVLVILNGCTDDSYSVASRHADSSPLKVRIIDETQLGLSHARNRGLLESNGDVIAFLDDDVRVDELWLAGLCNTLDAYDVDIIAGRTMLWWRDCPTPDWWSSHFNWVLSAFERGQSDHLMDDVAAVGANFAFTRKVMESIDGFNPELGRTGKALAAGEESDYLKRAEAAGFKAAYSAGALVEHLVPLKRINREYFEGVAKGQGRAYYLVRPRRGAKRIATFIYHLIQVIKHTLILLIARDAAKKMYYRVKRAGGLGALSGLRMTDRYR